MHRKSPALDKMRLGSGATSNLAPVEERSSKIDGSESVELTPAEINIKRLLWKCENMLDDGSSEDWRFEKYVEALEQMFLSFKATLDPNKRNSFGGERIADYKSRIDYLKRLAHPQLHVEDGQRKLLLERRSDVVAEDDDKKESLSCSKSSGNGIFGSLQDSRAPVKTKSPPSTLSTDSRMLNRTQLSSQDSGTSFQERNELPAKNMDLLVSAELGRQEIITEEMLTLAQTLKENMTAANQLVKRDFKVIDKATSIADKNVIRLNKEGSKLAEHTKKNTGWWVLLALAGLFGIFIMMVLFMRLFPKPRTVR